MYIWFINEVISLNKNNQCLSLSNNDIHLLPCNQFQYKKAIYTYTYQDSETIYRYEFHKFFIYQCFYQYTLNNYQFRIYFTVFKIDLANYFNHS